VYGDRSEMILNVDSLVSNYESSVLATINRRLSENALSNRTPNFRERYKPPPYLIVRASHSELYCKSLETLESLILVFIYLNLFSQSSSLRGLM
jgi:hypothetical protein